MKTNYIPQGYHTATPYLVVDNAAAAIDFYKKAFEASEIMRMPDPSGKVMHAEIQIGDSRIMLADECPQFDAKSPKAYGGSPITLMLYVKDVDSFVAKAISAGAKEVQPIKDQFYGDRLGSISDPFGHKWHIATHKEDVSQEELKKRAEAMFAQKK